MMMTLISACTDKAFRAGILPMAFLWTVPAVAAHNDNMAAWIPAGLRGRRRLQPHPIASARVSAAALTDVRANRRPAAAKALRRRAKPL